MARSSAVIRRVNQAPITGESVPIDKTTGDHVFAGTLNGEGSLEIRASRAATESTLAHIARLVEQAQAARSPTERFVDHFARRYTPAVILLAVLLAFVPPLIAYASGAEWASAVPPIDWFHRGLVLLVIACPCALVISTPVTIVCGLHHAARRGILVKGGASGKRRRGRLHRFRQNRHADHRRSGIDRHCAHRRRYSR